MWLTHEACALAHHAGSLSLMCYVELAQESMKSGECRWKVRPKMHDWQEILERILVDRLNPNYVQCINDESMLGVFKRTGRGCHRISINHRLMMRCLAEIWRINEGRS